MKYTLFWFEYLDEVFDRCDTPKSIKIIQYEDKNKIGEADISSHTIKTNDNPQKYAIMYVNKTFQEDIS